MMVKDAKKLLDEAISLHEGHMNGSVATSAASQKKLMDLLQKIRKSLAMKGMPGDNIARLMHKVL